MAHHILKNEIDLILPQLPAKQKQGIITALVSGFIGLAYEGISNSLHNRRHKALLKAVTALDKALIKAVKALDSKTAIQCNKTHAFGRFNGNVWHLQCRNIRKTHKHSTLHSQFHIT